MPRSLPNRPALLILLISLAAWLRPAGATEVDTGGTPNDLRRLANADRAIYHGRYSDAIAMTGQIIGSSPDFAYAYVIRARAYTDAGRYDEALADLDRVAALHPDAQLVFVQRAGIALRRRNAALALADLAHAATMPAESFWKQSYEAPANDPDGGHGNTRLVTQHSISTMYAYTSVAQELQGQDDAAIDSLQHALANEPLTPWYVLGAHCYIAAVAGLLEMAEFTCNQAIAQHTHDFGDYDSLGLVHLKMKAWTKAIADYDHALYDRPDLTLSLYGRGLAKRAAGQAAAGDADIAAARRGEPDIANIMARLGVLAARPATSSTR